MGSDPVLTAGAYDNRLAKASIAIRNHLLNPDIIAVQEVEKLSVLTDLAARILADAGPAGPATTRTSSRATTPAASTSASSSRRTRSPPACRACR